MTTTLKDAFSLLDPCFCLSPNSTAIAVNTSTGISRKAVLRIARLQQLLDKCEKVYAVLCTYLRSPKWRTSASKHQKRCSWNTWKRHIAGLSVWDKPRLKPKKCRTLKEYGVCWEGYNLGGSFNVHPPPCEVLSDSNDSTNKKHALLKKLKDDRHQETRSTKANYCTDSVTAMNNFLSPSVRQSSLPINSPLQSVSGWCWCTRATVQLNCPTL